VIRRRPPPDDLLPLRERDGVGEWGPLLLTSEGSSPKDLVPLRWEEVWAGMPSFEMGDTDALQKIVVCFRSREDVEKFAALLGNAVWTNGVGSRITEQTDSMWFGGPDAGYVAPREVIWRSRGVHLPRYPVYVPSVGRWEDPRTALALEAIGVPHRVVVEPAQRADYARALGEDRLLVLPRDYSVRNTGSIPARNWIWKHSLAEGHARHWVIDDNVRGFLRMHRNRRIPVADGAIFCAAEDFTDRYENVAFSGLNYMYLVKDRQDCWPPYYLNTRVYSMILVNNSLPYRWRGRYNEDTDICLRALKDGWCTVLFNAFLGDKAPTLTMGGGNTDTVYNTEGWVKRRAFAESLVEQHPDVAKRVWRYNRWHHEVDYSRYSLNRLRPSADPPVVADPEYGMELVRDGRASRYPKSEGMNGSAEGSAAVGDRDGTAGNGQEGDLRPGEHDRVRRWEGGGVQRRRDDKSSPTWSPRS
jgi:hypothetical protein